MSEELNQSLPNSQSSTDPALSLSVIRPPSSTDWLKYRLRWLACSPFSPKYGDKAEFSALVSLLTLGVVTTATFALTVNQIANSELLASIFYFAFILMVVILVAVIVNSQENGTLKYARSTVIFGRWISISTICLAAIFIFIAQMRWFPGQIPRRRDYIAMDIPCDKPILGTQSFLDVSPTGVFRPAFMEERDGIEQFKSWFGGIASLDPSAAKQQQVLIIEQSPGFDTDYNTFAAVIYLDPKITLDSAIVFVRRASSRVVDSHNQYNLEQLRLPVSNASATQLPVFEVTNPNLNDSLLIFLRVSAQKGGELNTVDPNGFHFKLRRLPR